MALSSSVTVISYYSERANKVTFQSAKRTYQLSHYKYSSGWASLLFCLLIIWITKGSCRPCRSPKNMPKPHLKAQEGWPQNISHLLCQCFPCDDSIDQNMEPCPDPLLKDQKSTRSLTCAFPNKISATPHQPTFWGPFGAPFATGVVPFATGVAVAWTRPEVVEGALSRPEGGMCMKMCT